MAIIGKVGKKKFSYKALNSSIHIVLLLGAITMIYPFLIMLSASFKSNVDSKNMSIVPKYFYNNEVLYKKFVEARYNEEINILKTQYKGRFPDFFHVNSPEITNHNFYENWKEFLTEYDESSDAAEYYSQEQHGRGVYTRNERVFRKKMKTESGGDILKFNEKYNSDAITWDEVIIEERQISSRNYNFNAAGMYEAFNKFKKNLKLDYKIYFDLDGDFILRELYPIYGDDLAGMNEKLGTDFKSWSQIVLSREVPDNELKDHWISFVKNYLNPIFINVKDEALPEFRNYLKDKYGSTEVISKVYDIEIYSFEDIVFPDVRNCAESQLQDYVHFISHIAMPEQFQLQHVNFAFRDWLEKKYGTIQNFETENSVAYTTFSSVSLPEEIPSENLNYKQDWVDFIRQQADISNISVKPEAQQNFHQFLKKLYDTDEDKDVLTQLNKTSGLNYKALTNVHPKAVFEKDKSLFKKYIAAKGSGKFLTVKTKAEESNWKQFLADKYATINVLNTNYGLKYSNFDDIQVDNFNFDHFLFMENKGEIKREFLIRNYAMVLDVMLFSGRAVFNTLIYCFLAILTALVVNPLAAYSMSRFKLPGTYKFILIFMLTMAFPPMVMGIPNFILLKKLNFLNTFWALILPGAADGYFIFLLKGFFDSLPKEIFESANIDGAGEFRIFWQFAMKLSKPIMAVIALGAFNAAYRNFMFAFIVCQDSEMWTIMVHIYQLMQRSSAGVGFAALVIAAIPTFFVFVFFQNIIIKGIVVPSEK